MNIHIATDHAGLAFKETVTKHLQEQGFDVVDHGAYDYHPDDDYPGFIISAATAVSQDIAHNIPSFGVIFGGSGNGEQITANKVVGIRAALVWNDEIAKLARQHNDANIISIGARQHTQEEALRLIDTFLAEPFSGDERHVRRIQQINDYELRKL